MRTALVLVLVLFVLAACKGAEGPDARNGRDVIGHTADFNPESTGGRAIVAALFGPMREAWLRWLETNPSADLTAEVDLLLSPDGRILQARVVRTERQVDPALVSILEELTAITLPRTGYDADIRVRAKIEFPLQSSSKGFSLITKVPVPGPPK